jgi:hypothetical protein
MLKTIIPQNSNNINLLKTFFQVLSRNNFDDYEKIEFVDNNSVYLLMQPYGYILSLSDSYFELEQGKSELVSLDEYNNIFIHDLVKKMNSSVRVLLNLCNETIIDCTDRDNIIIDKIFVKCYLNNEFSPTNDCKG